MAIMIAWIANLEEQWVIAGVQKYSCPVCMMSYRDLDQWSGAVGHTPRLPETTIAETRWIQQLYPEATTYEFKHEVLKHENGLSGTVEEFCWEGLPVGPHISLAQDPLHGGYKFIWDHVTKWLQCMIGIKELDHHFKAQPHLGSQNFSDGISKISQATGQEHQTYL